MMRARRTWGPAALALLCLLGACGGGGDEEGATSTTTIAATSSSSTTTSTSTTTTDAPTTTEPTDPWAVPDEIDEAYVQRVLTKLYEIEGDARRIAVREGLVTEEVLNLLNSIYSEDRAIFIINSFAEAAVTGFEGVKRPPGDVAIRVQTIHRGTEQCIFAKATVSYNAVATNPAPPGPLQVVLRPSKSNIARWRIEAAVASDKAAAVEDTCE